MQSSETFAQVFARNYQVIQMQTDGLTDADSLIQPPFRGNCMNWVLGHILYYRCEVLKKLGETLEDFELLGGRYKRYSEPVTSQTNDLASLSQLLDRLSLTQERITARLQQYSQEDLQSSSGGKTVAEQIAFLQWHETYHLGQLELLRQLTGTNDKII